MADAMNRAYERSGVHIRFVLEPTAVGFGRYMNNSGHTQMSPADRYSRHIPWARHHLPRHWRLREGQQELPGQYGLHAGRHHRAGRPLHRIARDWAHGGAVARP